jgi:DNA mismatch repair protein MutL
VDVNVHPTKTEVKFTRDGEVHHAVSQAVKQALLAYGIVPQARITNTAGASGHWDVGSLSGNAAQTGQQEMILNAPPSIFTSNLSAMPLLPELTPREQETGNRGQDIPPFDPFAEDDPAAPPAPQTWGENNPADARSAQVVGGNSQNVDGSPQTWGTGGAENPNDPATQQPDDLTVRPRPKPFAEQLREFRVLGQARNTYIIALTPDGIAVVDQHVAHERVLYERLTVTRQSNGIPVQRLAVPLTLNLSRREALLLAEHCESFGEAGWDIAPFGGESFVVRSVPALLANKPYEKVLRDMIDELVNQSVSRRLIVMRDHVTITNACKMAVKAGDPLTIPEMEGLLEQLADTENPYVCPHGRPIVVTIPFKELDKQFHRA